jgi:glycerophosphoryl diester phosphodiesterase
MSSIPKVIGHRGWPARFPGNTLAGFLAATSLVDGFELDVRRSSDGKLVLSHDPILASMEVAAHPWSVLAEADLGDGHRPALLDEVLSSIPTIPVQIEIKNDPIQPGYEPDHRLALEAAERARPGDVVTSFNWATAAAVRRVFPDVPTGIILSRHHDVHNAAEHCLDVGHQLLVPDYHLIDTPVADYSAGLEVIPFTVNEADLANELVGLGVSGIITDDPSEISAIRSRK